MGVEAWRGGVVVDRRVTGRTRDCLSSGLLGYLNMDFATPYMGLGMVWQGDRVTEYVPGLWHGHLMLLWAMSCVLCRPGPLYVVYPWSTGWVY
jgi:hypothetical protein